MSGVEVSTGAEAPGRPEAAPGLVIGLLGPTAVGKTAVAVALARALGTRVISCDSMQVYRGFAVLTDQPQSPQPGGVQHALVGFADPAEALSAVQYAALARPLLAADVAAGAAVIAGGTGLYLRAALAPLSTAPADPELRTALEARAAADGAGALHAELSRLDPQAAAEVDPKNTRRVVRALEAVLAGGGTRWSGREDLWDPVYDHPTLVVGLVRPRDILAARIAARSARMLEDGAVEEVDRYRREHGWETTEPGGAGILSAIGYREISAYLAGDATLNETAERIAAATRRYVRRQLTWLRKVRGAVIIDVQERGPEEIAREILDLALRKRTSRSLDADEAR